MIIPDFNYTYTSLDHRTRVTDYLHKGQAVTYSERNHNGSLKTYRSLSGWNVLGFSHLRGQRLSQMVLEQRSTSYWQVAGATSRSTQTISSAEHFRFFAKPSCSRTALSKMMTFRIQAIVWQAVPAREQGQWQVINQRGTFITLYSTVLSVHVLRSS